MKILFFHDGSDYSMPVLNHANLFGEHSMQVSACRLGSEEEAERMLLTDYDMVLVNQTCCSDMIVDCGKPVIIMERIDGSQLAGSRKWIPRVAGVIKSYALKPAALNNQVNGRFHAHLIAEATGKAKNTRAFDDLPMPQLSSNELKRIRVSYGFSAYPKFGCLQHQFVDFSSDREYALHFAGFVNYSETEIESHRKLCLSVMEDWSRKHPGLAIVGAGRALPLGEYWKTMYLSRAVVSPWGWGESCHRDYEAMLLGAVLVKPTMDHVDCWPQVYEPEVTYVKCATDFSDISEIIARIGKDWKLWRQRRIDARTAVLHSMHPARIIRSMVGAIRSLL